MATQLEGARLLLQARGAPRRPARHAAAARDRDGEGGGQPRGEVRVRRGDPAARRLRLLAASTPSSASTATSAGCASAPARSRSSATSSAPTCCAARPRAGTRGSPAACAAGRVAAAWHARHVPASARGRSTAAPAARGTCPTAATHVVGDCSRRSPAGCAAAASGRGDVVAWQAPNWPEVVAPLPGVLAARRDRGTDPPPGRRRRGRPHRRHARPRRCSSRADDVAASASPPAASGARPSTARTRDPSDLASHLDRRVRGDARRACSTPSAASRTRRRRWLGAHGLTAADAVLMPAPLAHISGLLNGVLVPGVGRDADRAHGPVGSGAGARPDRDASASRS